MEREQRALFPLSRRRSLCGLTTFLHRHRYMWYMYMCMYMLHTAPNETTPETCFVLWVPPALLSRRTAHARTAAQRHSASPLIRWSTSTTRARRRSSTSTRGRRTTPTTSAPLTRRCACRPWRVRARPTSSRPTSAPLRTGTAPTRCETSSRCTSPVRADAVRARGPYRLAAPSRFSPGRWRPRWRPRAPNPSLRPPLSSMRCEMHVARSRGRPA